MFLRTLVAAIRRLPINFKLIPDRFNVAPDPSSPAAADLRYSIFPILIPQPVVLRNAVGDHPDLEVSIPSNADGDQACGGARVDMPSDSVTIAVSIDQSNLTAVERDLKGSGRTAWERPQWMEILFDLAWTATFSGLTSNTAVTGLMTLVSYAFFFIIAWWMWASQMIYDTMFSANDAWHRVSLLLQFMGFLALSAFTSGFDLSAAFKDPELQDGSDSFAVSYVLRSFQAISLILCMTRLLLAVSYGLTLARDVDVTSAIKSLARIDAGIWRELFWGGIPIRTCIAAVRDRLRCLKVLLTDNRVLLTNAMCWSAVLYLVAYLFGLARNMLGGAAAAIQMPIWLLAVAIEIYCIFPRAGRIEIFNPLRFRRIPSRLSTLTAVVVGEGLNGFVGPIVNTARSSIGFDAQVFIQLILTGATIFLAFCLYARSFRQARPNSMHAVLLLSFVHFPVHLLLILFLEGLKSLLNLTTLNNTLNYWIARYEKTTSTRDLVTSYRQLGLDLGGLLITLQPIANQSVENHWGQIRPLALAAFGSNFTFANAVDDNLGQRLLVAAIQTIFNVYGVLDAQTNAKFQAYVNDAEGDSVQDLFRLYEGVSRWKIDDLMHEAEDDLFAPATWVTGVAAAVFLALGVLMLCEGIPRHRYAWCSTVLRFAGFGLLAPLSFLNLNPDVLNDWFAMHWTLPTIAIIYIIVLAVDYLIGWIAVCEMDGVSWWRIPLQPLHVAVVGFHAIIRPWIYRLRRAMTLDVRTVA